MEVKLYDDEILISSKNSDDSGDISSFFRKNNSKLSGKGDAYKAQVEVIKSDRGNYMTLSIRFIND